MSFQVPERVKPIRAAVQSFIEEKIYPVESILEERGTEESRRAMLDLMQAAKEEGLWALGHPKEIGGQGLPFLDYVYVNEVIGRSHAAMVALGTHSLQDSIMLHEFASDEWRDRYLKPLVAGEVFPSFGMTEPNVASSDPTQLQTSGVLEDGEWVINGHKWFISGADVAAYTTVMCRTEPDAPDHSAFSMIVVPTDTPGYEIIREPRVMGFHGGHCELSLRDVRVPESNLLGPRGGGFRIAQRRLGPRANERVAFGKTLGQHQQIQKFIFDSLCEIQASRMLTLQAAHKIDQGDEARVEIGMIKVAGAQMLHNVIDRAIQVFGAKGVTEDTPLERMYREARFARIYDGPDEVHVMTTARRVLKSYKIGDGWDFALS
jgi:alkylation response protein AidB-like acyl-CoA dehydrogenase